MTHAFWLGLIVGGAAWAIGGLVVDRVTAWAFGLSERVWHYRHVIRFRAAQGESLQSIAKAYGVEVRHIEALTRWGFASNGDAA